MRYKRGLYALLILSSILASLKMIFFAVGLDEEYQLVMAYRNARGDRLFLDMWEPHQSSAFLCSLLMKPYLYLFGTTGIVLYLRLWGTLIHLGISVCFYRVLKDILPGNYAWLLALTYYNTIPKQIILPEFGIMQVWSYTLLSLFLIRYYRNGRKRRYLVLAALALALNVLSYPSCLILYPFLLLSLYRLSGKTRWRDMGIVTLVCGTCAIGYLGMLFSYTPPEKLLETLSLIFAGDATHSFSLTGKLFPLLSSSLYLASLWAGCFLAALAAGRRKRLNREQICCLAAVLACGAALFYWVVLHQGYEIMPIHLAVFATAGLCACPSGKNSRRSAEDPVSLLRYAIAGAGLSLLAVICLTDLTFIASSIPHAMPGAFYGAGILILVQSQREEKSSSGHRWIHAALLVWCLTAIFGKGFSLRSSGYYDNVLQSAGILRNGPAAWTISAYMNAYIYNCDYEDWQLYLQDGDKVLIMVDQVRNLGTIQYLFKDVEISHFSIINPTVYDETLLTYWTLYPEKSPNVIIVDCWYGQLMTNPGSWMMDYIENRFGYTQAIDGRYIRIYRK